MVGRTVCDLSTRPPGSVRTDQVLGIGIRDGLLRTLLLSWFAVAEDDNSYQSSSSGSSSLAEFFAGLIPAISSVIRSS